MTAPASPPPDGGTPDLLPRPDVPPGLGPDTRSPWRIRLHEVIFGHHTPAGRNFDVLLILAIAVSVTVVMLESSASVRDEYGPWLRSAEWAFTLLFTAEYVLRLLCVARPRRYAFSFFGVIDLLAIVPTYLSLLLPGTQFLVVIRTLRFLRVFRVLKLARYASEGDLLARALWASRRKILVFLATVMTLVIVLGSLMYIVEGGRSGFDSIPRSVYWAVVTLTTVGYGDIAPQTGGGQAIAMVIMILGYGIIAVPTGIVTAEITTQNVAAAGARAAASAELHAMANGDVARLEAACEGLSPAERRALALRLLESP